MIHDMIQQYNIFSGHVMVEAACSGGGQIGHLERELLLII